nr:TetR/AcrR family transcriptional regulator [Citrobacter sp. JGM124]
MDATTEAIAEHGLGAATSLIAKKAGVAEGTLFRYFATKDVLFNDVYHHLKWLLGKQLMKTYNRELPVEARSRELWNGYINWGLVNIDARKAMSQLAVSGKITKDTLQKTHDEFPELRQLSNESITNEYLTCGENPFADAIFFALAETTMEFAAREPERKQDYIIAGFDVMWHGMTKA